MLVLNPSCKQCGAGQTANMVSYTGTDSLAVGSVTSSRPFLPHISGDWRFLRDHELYFDIAENMKTLPMAAYKQGASPFALTGEQYEKIKILLSQKQIGRIPLVIVTIAHGSAVRYLLIVQTSRIGCSRLRRAPSSIRLAVLQTWAVSQ